MMNSIGATITKSRVGGVILAVLLGLVVLISAQQVQAQEVPTIPNLAISDITETTALVTIEATAGCTVEDIVIDYREGTSGPYIDIASGVCLHLIGNEYELTGLTANTGYNVRVSASLADSTTTTEVITPFTTDPVAQAVITDITISSVTTTTATFVPTQSGSINLIWYRYRTTGVGAWAGGYSSFGAVTLTGLTENTGYELEALPSSNANGFDLNGSFWASHADTFRTSFTTASTSSPTSVTVSSVTDTTATFVATVTGNTYNLWWRYRTTGVGAWAGGSQSITGNPITITISGLTQVTAYELEVFHIGPGVTFSPTSNNWSNQYVARTSLTTAETNVAPTASASANPTTVNPGGTVALTGVASDGNSADTLTYSWASGNGGNFSSTTVLSPTWTPPIFTSDTDVTLTLTVNDGTVSINATVTVTVAATTLPHAPTALTLVASFTEIGTSWTAPVDTGTSSLSGYYLQYRVKGAPSWTSIDLSTTGTSHLIPSLNSGTTYQAQVAAKTSAGTGPYSSIEEATTGIAEGPWSDEVTATTTFSSLGKVLDLTVTSSTTSTLTVNWTDVSNADSYLVEWRKGTSGNYSSHTYTSSEATLGSQAAGESHENQGTGLETGESYEVRVKAKRMGYVDGASSTVVSGTVNLLDQVTGVAGTAGYNEIVLGWTQVTGAKGYSIRWGTSTGVYSLSNPDVVTANSYTITGLTGGIHYYIEVRANPFSGIVGVWSAELDLETLQPTLDQVTGLTVTSSATNSLNVNWNDTTDADSYLVEWRRDNSGDYSQKTYSTSEAIIENLGAGWSYGVRVIAKEQGHGDGPPSVIVIAAVNSLEQVTGVNATAQYNQISLTWSPVIGADNYVIKWGISAGTYTKSNPDRVDSELFTITGLIENTEYFIEISSNPMIGTPGAGAVLSETTPLQKPANPGSLALTVDSSTEITASWSSADRANSYVVKWATSKSGLNSAVGEAASGLTYQITGLSANTEYFVRVESHRSGTLEVGESEVKAKTTLLAPPADIANLGESAITATGFTVDWDDSNNATGYVIWWGTDSSFSDGTYMEEVLTGGTNSTKVLSSLVGDTEYFIRVWATRTGGDPGTASNTISVSTLRTGLGRVDGVSVDAISSTELLVSWNRLEGADSYTIQWNINVSNTVTPGGLIPNIAGTATSFTLSSLNNPGTPHYVRVRAIQTGGDDGNWSTEKIGTTKHVALAAPSTVGLTATSSTSLSFTWTGVSGATGFEVRYKKTTASLAADDDWTEWTHSDTAQIATITGLTPSTEYYAQVRTVLTDADEGDWCCTTSPGVTSTTWAVKLPAAAAPSLDASGTSITATWASVSGATGYDIRYRQSSGNGLWSEQPATSPHTITGLLSGQEYQVGIRGEKANTDDSSWSISSKIEVPSPGTVSSYTVSSTTTTATIHIDVTNPDEEPTDVYIRYQKSSVNDWSLATTLTRTTSGTTTEATITGLTPVTTYRIQASTSTSFPSADTVTWTTSTPNPRVSQVGASDVTTDSATITVTVEFGSGSYTVYLRYGVKNSWSPTEETASNSATRTYPLTGLASRQTYNVEASLDSNFPAGGTSAINFSTASPDAAAITQDFPNIQLTPGVSDPSGASGYRAPIDQSDGTTAPGFGSIDPSSAINVLGLDYRIERLEQTSGDVVFRLSGACPLSWTLDTFTVAGYLIPFGSVVCSDINEATFFAVGITPDTLAGGTKGVSIKVASIHVTSPRPIGRPEGGAGGGLGGHQRGTFKGTICALPDNILGSAACAPLMVFTPPIVLVVILLVVFSVTNPMILGAVGLTAMAGMALIVIPGPVMIIVFVLASAGTGAVMLLLRR